MKRWIVTMGGVGYLPASGTFASLLTCLILWPLFLWRSDPLDQTALAIGGTILFCALGLALGRWTVAFFSHPDPRTFVLDEAAGICLTCVLLPAHGPAQIAAKLLAVFLTFRLFDITKPFPLRRLERLPHAWGILADDLGAAVYANLICQILIRWLAPWPWHAPAAAIQ